MQVLSYEDQTFIKKTEGIKTSIMIVDEVSGFMVQVDQDVLEQIMATFRLEDDHVKGD